MKNTFNKFEIIVSFMLSKKDIIDYCLDAEDDIDEDWEDVFDYYWQDAMVGIKVRDKWHSFDFSDYIADNFHEYLSVKEVV